MEGVLRMRGATQEFEIPVPGRPRALELDPRGEILANFHSEISAPKRALYHRAISMAAAGRASEVEKLLREALVQPLDADRGPDDGRRRRSPEERMLDARIRLDLARVLTDQDRDADAERQLRLAERDLTALERGRFEIDFVNARARLDLRRGEFASALQKVRRLEDLLPSSRSSFVSWRQYWLYLQVQSRSGAAAELAALHATAARLAGDEDDYRRASAEAADRGCDLSALRAIETDREDEQDR
jgi:hypothetical protein